MIETETEVSLNLLIEKLELEMSDEQKEITILKRQITEHETNHIGQKLERDKAKERLIRLRNRLGLDGPS